MEKLPNGTTRQNLLDLTLANFIGEPLLGYDIYQGHKQAPAPSNEGKTKAVIIPENLDLDKLLTDFKPQGFRPQKDRLYYLIGLMAEIPSYDHRILDDDPLAYLPLSSQILKRKIHDYDTYLKYLCAVGVLECDNQYIVGGKSKGYRLTQAYRTPGKLQLIKEIDLLNNSNGKHLEHDETSAILFKSFNGLEIDLEQAMNYLMEERNRSLRNSRRVNHGEVNLRFNSYMSMIQRFAEKDFYLRRDTYSGRIHSNLTNLKSEYRHFLSYNGLSLVEVDLRNAMALFTLSLLETEFYEHNTSDKITFLDLILQGKFDIKCFDLLSHSYLYSIMCGTFTTPAIEDELNMFRRAVTSGEFYEVMGSQIAQYLGKDKTRDQVKSIMFSVLFSSSDENRESILFQKSLFDELFPTVGQVLDEWRDLGHSNLARIIQRIETHIFLDCVVPKVWEVLGEIPIFTIHDSIVTLEDYVDDVQNIMYEEINSRSGFEPYLVPESWNQEKISHDKFM
jgi:hypothetical protein